MLARIETGRILQSPDEHHYLVGNKNRRKRPLLSQHFHKIHNHLQGGGCGYEWKMSNDGRGVAFIKYFLVNGEEENPESQESRSSDMDLQEEDKIPVVPLFRGQYFGWIIESKIKTDDHWSVEWPDGTGVLQTQIKKIDLQLQDRKCVFERALYDDGKVVAVIKHYWEGDRKVEIGSATADIEQRAPPADMADNAVDQFLADKAYAPGNFQEGEIDEIEYNSIDRCRYRILVNHVPFWTRKGSSGWVDLEQKVRYRVHCNQQYGSRGDEIRDATYTEIDAAEHAAGMWMKVKKDHNVFEFEGKIIQSDMLQRRYRIRAEGAQDGDEDYWTPVRISSMNFPSEDVQTTLFRFRREWDRNQSEWSNAYLAEFHQYQDASGDWVDMLDGQLPIFNKDSI